MTFRLTPHAIRLIAQTCAIPLVVTVGWLAWALSVRDRLPDPFATHFEADGVADHFSSPTVAEFIEQGAFIAGFTLLLVACLFFRGSRQGPVARWMAGLTAGSPVLVAVLLGTVVRRQLDLPSSEHVTLPWTGLVMPLLVGTAVGTFVALIVEPEPAESALTADAPEAEGGGDHGRTIPVRPGGKLAWHGQTRSARFLQLFAFGAIALLLTVFVLAPSWWSALAAVATAVVLLSVLSWRIAIDARGVLVRSALGWPRFFVELHDIDHAEVADVRFGNWGGWGVRFGSYGTGIITRNGKALRVVKQDGTLLDVTCNTPETAAGAIRSLTAPAKN